MTKMSSESTSATRFQMKALTKSARKEKMKALISMYKLDKNDLRQFKDALSINDTLNQALKKNVSWTTLKSIWGKPFDKLIVGTKMAVDITGKKILVPL